MIIHFRLITFLYILSFSPKFDCSNSSKKRKDVRDYTDADLEKLYDQWEENDEDELEEDEKPLYQRRAPQVDLDALRQKAGSPDDLVKLTKKGQTVMMFVAIRDPASTGKTSREFTDQISALWQTNFHNNHIDAKVFIVDDDRVLYMFSEGSQAWEAREFLLKQPECKEVVLEGKTTPGRAATTTEQLHHPDEL